MFIQHYKQADARAIAEGENWYPTTRRICQTLAARYGHSVETVAAIVAVTSQRVTWKYNLTCTVRALKGLEVNHLRHVRDKIARLLDGDAPGDVVSGQKVRAFWRAIVGDRQSVVLDTWMLGAVGCPHPSPKQYKIIAEILRTQARNAGRSASEFQAIVWCAIRGRSF